MPNKVLKLMLAHQRIYAVIMTNPRKVDRRALVGILLIVLVVFPVGVAGAMMILDGIFPSLNVTPTTHYYLVSFGGGLALFLLALGLVVFLAKRMFSTGQVSNDR